MPDPTQVNAPLLLRSGYEDSQAPAGPSAGGPPLIRSDATDSELPVPLGSPDVDRITFGMAIPSMRRLEGPSQSAYDVAGASAASHQPSPAMDAATANQMSKAAGGPDNLFTTPTTEAVAKFTIQRNTQMARDQELVAKYDSQFSWYDPSFLASHAVAFAADPIGLAATLVTGGAGKFIESGSSIIADRLGGGFLARSAGRAATGAAIGAGTQAMISAGHLEQTNLGIGDYGIKDALTDIALQAGLGAGLDVGLGAALGGGARLKHLPETPAEAVAERMHTAEAAEPEATPVATSTLSDNQPLGQEAGLARVTANIGSLADEAPYLSPKSVNDLQIADKAVNQMNVFLKHQDAIRNDEFTAAYRGEEKAEVARKLDEATAPHRQEYEQAHSELVAEQVRLSQHLLAVSSEKELASVQAELATVKSRYADLTDEINRRSPSEAHLDRYDAVHSELSEDITPERRMELESERNRLAVAYPQIEHQWQMNRQAPAEPAIHWDDLVAGHAPEMAAEDAAAAKAWQSFSAFPGNKKPPKPKIGHDVLSFMRSVGGLWDPRHDLAGTHGLRPGLDMRKGGHSVDAMGLKLYEARFFGPPPEDFVAGRPDETAVLNLIADAKAERHGKIYSHDDMATLDQHRVETEAWEEEQRVRALHKDIEHESSKIVGGLSDSEKGHILELVHQGTPLVEAVESVVERGMLALDKHLDQEIERGRRSEHDIDPFSDAAGPHPSKRHTADRAGSNTRANRSVRPADSEINQPLPVGRSEAGGGERGSQAEVGASIRDPEAERQALTGQLLALEKRHAELADAIRGRLSELEAARQAALIKGLQADLSRRQKAINQLERQIAKAEGRSVKAQRGLDVPHVIATAKTEARQAALEAHTAHSIRRFAGGLQRKIGREEAHQLARDLLRGDLKPDEVVEFLEMQPHTFRGAIAEIASARAEAIADIARTSAEFMNAVAPVRQEAAAAVASDVRARIPDTKAPLPEPRPAPHKPKGEPSLVLGEKVPETPELADAMKRVSVAEAVYGAPPAVKSVEGALAVPRFADPELAATEAELIRSNSITDAAKEAAACLLRAGA